MNLMTKNYLDDVAELKGLEPLMEQMEQEGIWKMIKKVIADKNVGDKKGHYTVFKKH